MTGLLVARRGSLNPRGAAAAGYAAEVLADSPVGYWRMEETSGSSIADSSVNSNTGTVVGANLNVSGLAATGSAVSFDGTDDYINFGTGVKGLLDGTALTVEAWIKSTSTAQYRGIAVMDNLGDASERSFQLRTNIDGNRIDFVKIPNTTVTVTNGTTNVADGSWHHVAATYDGSTIRVYVDGAEEGSAGASGSTLGTLATDFFASANPRSGPGDFYDGAVDELAVYAQVLSAARVLAHYDAGVA